MATVTSKTAFDILGALEGHEDVDEAELPEDDDARREREAKAKAKAAAQQQKALAKQQLQAAKQQQAEKANQVPPKLNLPFELLRRTRMCDDWVNSGRCKNGSDCVFAHDVQEKNANCARVKQYQAEQYAKMGYTAHALRLAAAAAHLTVAPRASSSSPPAPTSAAAASASSSRASAPVVLQRPPAFKGPMYKTRLCRNFMRGHCASGGSCGFAHGEHELREPPAPIYGSRQEPERQQEQQHSGGNGAAEGPAGPSNSSLGYAHLEDMAYYAAGPAASVGTAAQWAGAPGANGPGSAPGAGSMPGAGPREMEAGALAALMRGLEMGDDEEEHFAFLCPITQERMREPVVAADGYSYERQAIQAWLTTRDSSPMTNEQLDDKVLIPNLTLLDAMRVVYGEE